MKKILITFMTPVVGIGMRPWRCGRWRRRKTGLGCELVQFQELTDRLDVLRKVTGIRIQEQYNTLLRNGGRWEQTVIAGVAVDDPGFPWALVKLLERFWKEHPADLLLSVIPHFNREIAESWEKVYPGRPFVRDYDLRFSAGESGLSRRRIDCDCGTAAPDKLSPNSPQSPG